MLGLIHMRSQHLSSFAKNVASVAVLLYSAVLWLVALARDSLGFQQSLHIICSGITGR
jgi:diacylglycerol kinase